VIEQAVILAAGRGTRLGELTKDRPKSMLPVLGKPIMVRVMDRLREAGIRRFVVVIGEHEGAMASYLNRSWYADMEVRFALQAVPTGTADALMMAAPYIEGDFLLTSVDSLTSLDHIGAMIRRFDEVPGQMATLSLLPATPEKIRASADVVIEGEWITAIVEKPEEPKGKYASIMLYAFSWDILPIMAEVKFSARGEREIVSGIQTAIAGGAKVGYVPTDWRLHLTRDVDLHAINMQFLNEGRDCHILSEIPDSVRIIAPVRIDPKVSVGQRAVIGPNVYLESGTVVGQGAILRECVALNGAVIAAEATCVKMLVAPQVQVTIP